MQVQLVIISTDKVFFDEMVDIVTVDTGDGQQGFMYNHVPTISIVEIGAIHINWKNSNNYKLCATSSGLIYVEPKKITILTPAIEFVDEINLERALKARKIAEEQLALELQKPVKDSVLIEEYELKLKRAINRIQLKEH